ncbi:MAG TPA: MATE family efflux transporter [Lachnospiraceae bacterium]|nr:MATE family efflux transporter [Lachnospiraceae bacterium]
MENELFETLPVPKAIIKLAAPTMLGMLVTIIYNLADTFFVGQLKDANQVAAVTIAMPIFMCLMSLGSIFGIGGGSYISRLLGQKRLKQCKQTSSVAFYCAIVVGIFCCIAGLLAINPILNVIGASQMTFSFAKSYLVIIIGGAPFVILSFSLGQTIRAEGAAKNAMFGMMLGTIINIALDPLLILYFKMGVAGAAYATIIANIASVFYYIQYMLKKSPNLSVLPKDFHPSSELFKNIFSIGLPASISTLLFSFSNIVLNNFAASYGDNVVASLGIVAKATMLPAMLLIGLAQGVQPLIGYNYASGNHERMHSTIITTGIAGTTIGVFFSILIFSASPHIIGAFLQDAEVIAMGTGFLRVNIISVPFMGCLFLMINVFQAMGKALPSMILSVSRQGIVFIPVLIVSNAVIGLNGLVYAQPTADICSTMLSIFLYYKILHQKHEKCSK